MGSLNSKPDKALEKFIRWTCESGIISATELKTILEDPARSGQIQSVNDLVSVLLQQDHLTPYQSKKILEGKYSSLILGNCLIIEKLGQGGMGLVLKARHRRMDRIVAVKILSPSMTKTSALLARFQQEVKVAARLQHPNVVTAYDADEAHGIHYLVMQYVEGTDFASIVKKNGPLSIAQAVQSIRQTALGLEYAHTQGVIHRDIKPANLLLDVQGNVKILDMGLARLSVNEQSPMEDDLTGSGVILGTAAYMAPEQALDSKRADFRSDIYSLGCVLFYMLTGRPVFREETFLATVVAHREQAVPDLCRSRNDVPESLNKIFLRMVAKKVEDRYQTMREVLDALENYLKFDHPGSERGVLIEDSNLRKFVDGLQIAVTPTQIIDRHDTTTEKDSPVSIELPTSRSTKRNPTRSVTNSKSIRKQGVFSDWKIWGSIVVLLLGAAFFLTESQDKSGTLVLRGSGDQFPELGLGQSLSIRHQKTKSLQAVLLNHVETRLTGLAPGIYDFVGNSSSKLQVSTEQFEIHPGKLTQVQLTCAPSANSNSHPVWSKLPVNAPAPAILPFGEAEALRSQQAWADYLNIPAEFTNSIGMTFRLIPPGEFQQGITASQAEYFRTEALTLGLPQWIQDGISSRVGAHLVCLTQPYYISRTEVMQSQFELVTGENPSALTSTGYLAEMVVGMDTKQLPVDTNWFQAVKFCNSLSDREKRQLAYHNDQLASSATGYRLPTEAEWEFACRAGTTTRWWWGNDSNVLAEQEWSIENALGSPRPIATSQPNPFGLFDMHGNYWEWCHDWYEPFTTQFWEPYTVNPSGAVSGELRVGKGGNFDNPVQVGSSDYRGTSVPERTDAQISFRIVLPVQFPQSTMREQ